MKSDINNLESEIADGQGRAVVGSSNDRLKLAESRFQDFDLPEPWSDDLKPSIRARVVVERNHKLVVLDDDPTGTQTVHGIPVLTEWSVGSLRSEFENDLPCFYLLTNSRSVPENDARALNEEIARNLRTAAGDHGSFTVVSRSDSTLRGHYPAETDVLDAELGPFDATLVIPYFEAGGRYTIDDVHYVVEGDELVPASETPFAQDAAFGYHHSNLKEWVAEKTGGRIESTDVQSVSLGTLREDGPGAVAAFLETLSDGAVCVVNAADPTDLDVLVSALLSEACSQKKFLFRTGAQFVSARLGLESKLLSEFDDADSNRKTGGLIVVGSYVPKTTSQLKYLCDECDLEQIELSVESMLNEARRSGVLTKASGRLDEALGSGRDVVLFTTRELVSGDSAESSLEIGRVVSDALVQLVRLLSRRPRFLIAKGGITSSDVATKGLGIRRAMVEGQILPGVPVWRTGDEAKFPDLPYIVFPGNVGGTDALAQAYRKFNT